MVKTLNLNFDDKKFEKLKQFKEKAEKTSEERISWENFVFISVCGK